MDELGSEESSTRHLWFLGHLVKGDDLRGEKEGRKEKVRQREKRKQHLHDDTTALRYSQRSKVDKDDKDESLEFTRVHESQWRIEASRHAGRYIQPSLHPSIHS